MPDCAECRAEKSRDLRGLKYYKISQLYLAWSIDLGAISGWPQASILALILFIAFFSS